ncbi:MAG: RpiB/LacA/LacB family sugar-phosphate isomerase [Rhodospirillales bacterium]|jgi:ribose 5-phosphate isomerase B|nr:RpiB/LacA/LacB family sugar-phosphate isomerase [Rhodospirillales bacterium]
MKRLAIGGDPNALDLKNALIAHIKTLGHQVDDFGSDDPIYANVAIRVAEAVASGTFDRGVLLCGTGIGVSLAANKVKGAYAVVATDVYSVDRSVRSNNANIMTFGAQVMGAETAKSLLDVWLSAEYEPGGRSAPKIQRIYDYSDDMDHRG